MKLYATVSSERACKGQGGNKHIRIELFYGNTNDSKKAITILGKVLSPEASQNNKESAVFQIWGEDKELCERIVCPL